MTLKMKPVALALTMLGSPLGAWADASLPEVQVSASREGATDLPTPYAGGQVAKGARLGLLGNVDLMDTPFNITSYTAELMENRHARNVGDVLLNDASVRNTTSSGHPYENFRIRGFDVNSNDMAINGLFGLTPIGHTPVEMFERVEVQKGPGAMFTGMAPSGAVGGVINLVPKRAGDDPLTRVSVGYQTASQASTQVDIGRRFGENKDFGLRINGSYGDGEAERRGQDKTREFLSLALDYRGGAFKGSVDAYHSKETHQGGTPAMFWFASTTIPSAPDSRINEFPAGWGKLSTDALMARGEYEFSPNFSAFAAAGVADSDYAGWFNGSHVRSIDANGNSTASVTVSQLGYERNTTAEAGLRGRFSTGQVVHEMVLQASNLDQESGSDSARSAIPLTNIYNPTYWATPATPGRAPKTAENTFSSLALVDTLSMLEDKVRLTVGVRSQRVKTTNFNASGGVSGAYDKRAVTPAVGLVWKPWAAPISLYANYVEGLSKGDSVTKASGYAQDYTFAPYKTEQQEVGVKWNAGRFAHTASLFQITKPMLLASGKAPNLQATDGGEKRVRGLEWNTFGELRPDLRLLGGVSYSDGVQTKTQGGLYDGKQAVGAPHWQGNLGAEWDTPWLAGLTLTSRVTYTSSQYLDSANTQTLPAWTVLDLGVRYTTRMGGRKLVTRLNVDNVFDKHYYSGAFSDTTPVATLGLGRVVSVSGTLDF